MKRGLGEIVGIEGNIVVGRIGHRDRRLSRKFDGTRDEREGFSRLVVSLDDDPAGLAEISPATDGRGIGFRFALPSHRIAATFDVADPLTGRSVLGRSFDLSGHYRL